MDEKIDFLYKQTIEEFEPLYYTDYLAYCGNEDTIEYNYME